MLCGKLSRHSLYGAIQNKKNLRVFMEHHVYAVWDFMSLIKELQAQVAPAGSPWLPSKNARYVNFTNKLVLEEESDYALAGLEEGAYASHFESYLQAMIEVGADVDPVLGFIDKVREKGLDAALQLSDIPEPAKRFMLFTFDVIGRSQLHYLVAVLAYGRESIIPQLYRSFQEGLQVLPSEAPIFYGYLKRHIFLDEQEHGPVIVNMVQSLSEGSMEKQAEVVAVAEQALVVRLEFWDEIHAALLP